MALLECYSSEQVQATGKARILLLGPPKIGKTTAIAKGAPEPLLINCDGKNAALGAVNQGARFKYAVDVNSGAQWVAACGMAKELAEKGDIKSVIVDTASLLNYTLISENKRSGAKGWDIYTQATETAMRGFDILRNLNAHLFVVSHLKVEGETVAGIMPDVKGELKALIPRLIEDWVMIELDPVTGKRNFLVGAQKFWTPSGRNIKRSCVIEADVGLLFKELGINP